LKLLFPKNEKCCLSFYRIFFSHYLQILVEDV
jgi:hypothetical protein